MAAQHSSSSSDGSNADAPLPLNASDMAAIGPPPSHGLPSVPSDSQTRSRSSSASESHGPRSSRTVLTIALQKAQAAVELDTNHDDAAAIAAYTQSIGLLDQVLQRLEHSANTWKHRELAKIARLHAGPQSPEVSREIRKRSERIARKEAERYDETHRLRTIHDTYQDRIRMIMTEASHQSADPGSPLDPGLASRFPSSSPPAASAYNYSRPLRGHANSLSTASSNTDSSSEFLASFNRQSFQEIPAPLNPALSSDFTTPTLPHAPLLPDATPASNSQTPIARAIPHESPPQKRSSLMRNRSASNASTSAKSPPLLSPTSTHSLDSQQPSPAYPNGASFLTLASIPASPAEETTIHSRSTSAASQDHPESSHLLISSSTAQGTISQRRRIPSQNPDPSESLLNPRQSMDGDTIRASEDSTRKISSAVDVFAQSAPTESPHPFAYQATISANNTDVAASSLPLRLRAVSQPGRRPALPSFATDSDVPSMPTPFTANELTRKVSAPITQSLAGDFRDRSSSPMPKATRTGATPTSAVFSLSMRPDTASLEVIKPPSQPMRRPFHFLKLVRLSILSGSHITAKLYVPKQIWLQGGVKLTFVETKVRMLDLLVTGCEGLERAGDPLILGVNAGIKVGKVADKFEEELGNFEGLANAIQTTFSKKLDFVETLNGKKSGQSSFGAWSSKLSRSLDRMTTGKNLDTPESYVQAISRTCQICQILDQHIICLSSPQADSPYASLTAAQRQSLETRLRTVSEFFGRVICRVILKDLEVWLERYAKRISGFAQE